jgi:hypothetical protein
MQASIQQMINIMQNQLQNPYTGSTVRQGELIRCQIEKFDPALASKYWSWICIRDRSVDTFGQEVTDLQRELDAFDDSKKFVMPSWGTYGT